MIYLFTKRECGPCLIVDKFIKSQAQEVQDKITIHEISDPDENVTELLRLYEVKATPSLVVTAPNGDGKAMRVGVRPIMTSFQDLITYHDNMSAQ